MGAAAIGIEPEVLTGQVGTIVAAFEEQARAAMTKAIGIDAQNVLEWVWEHRADELNKAMVLQGTERSTAGYVALAQEFLENLADLHPDAVLGAASESGVTTGRDADGRITVTVNGVTHPWKTAVRLGLLKVGARGS